MVSIKWGNFVLTVNDLARHIDFRDLMKNRKMKNDFDLKTSPDVHDKYTPSIISSSDSDDMPLYDFTQKLVYKRTIYVPDTQHKQFIHRRKIKKCIYFLILTLIILIFYR